MCIMNLKYTRWKNANEKISRVTKNEINVKEASYERKCYRGLNEATFYSRVLDSYRKTSFH